jgi:antitoxin component HigA of HigAB toxin-antitoxin module
LSTINQSSCAVQENISVESAIAVRQILARFVKALYSKPLTLILHFSARISVLPRIDALIYLMEEHSLSQSDLPEIGSQGVVSEILNGKRKLNVRQIQLLAERFQVSTATFFDGSKGGKS